MTAIIAEPMATAKLPRLDWPFLSAAVLITAVLVALVLFDGQPASEAYRGLLRRKVGRETRSQPVR